MQIIVDTSSHNFENVGDSAMLITAVARLRENWPDADIHVLVSDGVGLQQFCPSVHALDVTVRSAWARPWNIVGRLQHLTPRSLHSHLKAFESAAWETNHRFVRNWVSWRLRKRGVDLSGMNEWLNLLETTDLYLCSGGGYLTDAFEEHAILVLNSVRYAKARGAVVAMMGQGIGPVTSHQLLSIMRRTIPKVDLFGLREGIRGLQLLELSGVPRERIVVTGDDAIEYATGAGHSVSRRAIGINVRVARYSQTLATQTEQVRRVLDQVARKHGLQLLGIPISRHQEETDVDAIKSIFNISNADRIGDLKTPRSIIDEIARCKVVVTGSYHAGVFALAQGIPVVGLYSNPYYKDKFNGLCHQFENRGAMSLDMHDSEFARRLPVALDALLRHAEMYRINLCLAAANQVAVGRRAYKRLASIVERRRAA